MEGGGGDGLECSPAHVTPGDAPNRNLCGGLRLYKTLDAAPHSAIDRTGEVLVTNFEDPEELDVPPAKRLTRATVSQITMYAL